MNEEFILTKGKKWRKPDEVLIGEGEIEKIIKTGELKELLEVDLKLKNYDYQVLKKLASLTIKTKKGGDMIKNEVFAALRGIWEITEKDIIFDVLGLTEEERKEVFNLPKISFADEKNLIFSEVSCII